jgi:hypothetical protein
MQNFIERHNSKIKGVISCFDRIVLTGTIPGICYAEGMTSLLSKRNIRIFDYTDFVEPMREKIRLNAEKLAEENGLEIDLSAKRIFEMKTALTILSNNEVRIQDLCIYSRQWKPALLISPGTIKKLTKHISRQYPANVCTITSTLLLLSWACVI